MRVLILGGDGYLGWPTAMSLSNSGHDVHIVDNYSRRQIAKKLNVQPLIQQPDLKVRVKLWERASGRKIGCGIGDVTDYQYLSTVVEKFQPDSIIHYAEQPSAPYSMLGYEEAKYTLTNNLVSTLNVIYAVKELDSSIHIVKLGTMGEYGTPDIDIEEGYIDIVHKGRKDRFLFPRQAGSLYHTTKIQDTDLLYFYVRMWGLRVTDLMQGPVYGVFTKEMSENQSLETFFSYDEIFGTVLNRFFVQAVIDMPLLVYGNGKQTRGFLNIRDTMQCIELALLNLPDPGEMSIYNQFTESFSVIDLASMVQRVGTEFGFNTRIEHVQNPRIEKEGHYYKPDNSSFKRLGLKPQYLDDNFIVEMFEYVTKHKHNISPTIIRPKTSWN
jgi:UDP-sulfoquinovose synthase